MNTKEILLKLKDVFTSNVDEVDSNIELSEESKELEVVTEEVELMEETSNEEVKEAVVEYATKLELQELKKTFLELLDAMQKSDESKADVPQDLSSDKEVELASEEVVEEIAHSPELEVDKVVNFSIEKRKENTIKSRIYSKLFN